MTRLLIHAAIFFALSCLINQHVSADTKFSNNGFVKYDLLIDTYPENSLFRSTLDTPAINHDANIRLNLDWKKDNITLKTDYQFITLHGDRVFLANTLPAPAVNPGSNTDDDRRLMDLSHIISSDKNSIIYHRLDRLYLDISTANSVARFGRQAISWGNGLIFSAMDLFNPFDPSAIDKEYKSGDDMLYAQHLRYNGDDIQAVWVLRRNNSGNTSRKVNSIALKYHGFATAREYDLLIATHYNETILGFGGVTDIADAVWRGDITVTNTSNNNVTSLVTSLSYSWIILGHNVSAIAEYFYNGFGITDGDYSPAALASKPDLINRYTRGELFTLAREYLSASATIEITPLWLFTPTIIFNATDLSSLIQLSSTFDIRQDWQLTSAITLPTGATGTEYGGIDSSVAGKQLSTDVNLYLQLAAYF